MGRDPRSGRVRRNRFLATGLGEGLPGPSLCRMVQPEVVTLCGSIRFAREHLAAHRRLSLEARVVLLPALPMPGDELLPTDIDALAALHRQKIAMCDRVHIVNPDGYVGASTASEIAYAEALGKEVTYEHGAG